jgi:ABC-type sulfate transport system permease component
MDDTNEPASGRADGEAASGGSRLAVHIAILHGSAAALATVYTTTRSFAVTALSAVVAVALAWMLERDRG